MGSGGELLVIMLLKLHASPGHARNPTKVVNMTNNESATFAVESCRPYSDSDRAVHRDSGRLFLRSSLSKACFAFSCERCSMMLPMEKGEAGATSLAVAGLVVFVVVVLAIAVVRRAVVVVVVVVLS